MLLVMVLCRSMTSRVALVMAPLLPGIRIGVGNNGLRKRGGGNFEFPLPQQTAILYLSVAKDPAIKRV